MFTFFYGYMNTIWQVARRWPTTPLELELWAVYYLQWKKNKEVAALDREKKQFVIPATVWDVSYLLGKSGYKHAYTNVK